MTPIAIISLVTLVVSACGTMCWLTLRLNAKALDRLLEHDETLATVLTNVACALDSMDPAALENRAAALRTLGEIRDRKYRNLYDAARVVVAAHDTMAKRSCATDADFQAFNKAVANLRELVGKGEA